MALESSSAMFVMIYLVRLESTAAGVGVALVSSSGMFVMNYLMRLESTAAGVKAQGPKSVLGNVCRPLF